MALGSINSLSVKWPGTPANRRPTLPFPATRAVTSTAATVAILLHRAILAAVMFIDPAEAVGMAGRAG